MTGVNTRAKGPRSRCHLFQWEQIEMMTGKYYKNYRSILSRKWKEIKKDTARLIEKISTILKSVASVVSRLFDFF